MPSRVAGLAADEGAREQSQIEAAHLKGRRTALHSTASSLLKKRAFAAVSARQKAG